MGTHPIFESDFDCLTDSMLGLAWVIRDAVPNYLRSVPIPYNFADVREMTAKEWAHLAIFMGASGYTGYAIYNKCMVAPAEPRVNSTVKLAEAKVVDAVEAADIDTKAVFCRCWKSKKFPYCDGAHAKHNQLTGDNVGPLIVKISS